MTSDDSKPRKGAAAEESSEESLGASEEVDAIHSEAEAAALRDAMEDEAAEHREAADEDDDEADGPAAALTLEVADLRNQLLRALAETENTRRRAERDRAEASKYGVSGLARDLLVVVDNLRRAIESVPADKRGDEGVSALLTGVEMIEREFLNLLERYGVTRIDPLGAKFDHNLHQAMFEVPTADQPGGTVAQVVQPGYLIADRLLRPAMVGVAKTPPPSQENEAEADSEPES